MKWDCAEQTRTNTKHASQHLLFISCISQISPEVDNEFCLAEAWALLAIAPSVHLTRLPKFSEPV
jgi:hypothetical protein